LGYTQRQSLALSFAHITCLSPICSEHFKRYNISFSFQSLFFHIGFISRPVTKKQNLVGHGHGQGSSPFLFVFFQYTFVPVVEFSQWFPHSLFLLGIPLPLPGLPLLLFFCKACVILTIFRPPWQQRPLRLSFAPTMRRKQAQFAAVGNKSQKLKYAKALASLPKQVLQDILDTVNVYNESDQPFHLLKDVLLGQFGKSKWQPYFELL
jgi:hypothetical protein